MPDEPLPRAASISRGVARPITKPTATFFW